LGYQQQGVKHRGPFNTFKRGQRSREWVMQSEYEKYEQFV